MRKASLIMMTVEGNTQRSGNLVSRFAARGLCLNNVVKQYRGLQSISKYFYPL
jgi:hypothetical protein